MSKRPSPTEVRRIQTALQKRHLMTLYEFRYGNAELALEKLLSDGIDLSIKYLPSDLGIRIGYTSAEEDWLKYIAGSYSGYMYPNGLSKAETEARRYKKERSLRTALQRLKRQNSRADKLARKSEANEIDCRASAILIHLSSCWVSTANLMALLKHSRAFRTSNGRRQLTGNSLRQAIIREFKKPKLSNLVEINQSFKDDRGNDFNKYKLC